jgi:hypothetical protein
MLAMAPLEGYQLEREGSHAVALELAFDDELRREGLAREVVHAVQNARKAAGLAVEDRIRLVLGGDAELLGAAQAHEDYLVREVLAVEIAYDGSVDGHVATIEDASCASAWRAPERAQRTRASSRLCAAPVPIRAREGGSRPGARTVVGVDHATRGGRHGPRQAAHGGGGDPGRLLDELRRRVRGGRRLRRRGARREPAPGGARDRGRASRAARRRPRGADGPRRSRARRALLEREGLAFDERDRASQDARVRLPVEEVAA